MSPSPETTKKPIPLWLKIGIAVVAVFVLLGFTISFAMTLLRGCLSEQGIELTEKGLEKYVERQIKKEEGADVDVNFTEKGLIIRDKEGRKTFAVMADDSLPEDFPDDIPIAKGMKIIGSFVMGPMTSLTLEGDEDFEDVLAFYQEELPDEGWTRGYEARSGEKQYHGTFKKGNRMLSLGLTQEKKQLSLQLSYHEKVE